MNIIQKKIFIQNVMILQIRDIIEFGNKMFSLTVSMKRLAFFKQLAIMIYTEELFIA